MFRVRTIAASITILYIYMPAILVAMPPLRLSAVFSSWRQTVDPQAFDVIIMSQDERESEERVNAARSESETKGNVREKKLSILS